MAEDGPLKTAEGVLRVKVPHVRGMDEPSRSQLGATLAKTSDHLKTLIVEMFVGGMAPRAMAAAVETALGHFVLAKRSLRSMTDTLSQVYEALRPRGLRGYDVA